MEGILTKGQPTEVLAESGESAEDAERTQRAANLPCPQSEDTGGGKSITGRGSWSPGRQEVLGKKYNLGRDTPPEILQSLLHTTLDWKRGERWKKHPSFSLPSLWSPTCAFLLLAKPEASWKESAQGKNSKEEGSGSREGLGRRGKSTRKLNYVTVPGVWLWVAGWGVSLWSHFSEVYQEIPFWENNLF